MRRFSAVRRTSAAFACAAMILGGLGCQYNRAPGAGRADPYPAPQDDPRISVLSPELRGWIVFQPPVVTGGRGVRPLDVQVPARNEAERQYLIDYRFLFYDDVGREVEPLMGWRMVALNPKQVVRLKANALDTQAESYRLEVKWAR